jgi:hypothetical protein
MKYHLDPKALPYISKLERHILSLPCEFLKICVILKALKPPGLLGISSRIV